MGARRHRPNSRALCPGAAVSPRVIFHSLPFPPHTVVLTELLWWLPSSGGLFWASHLLSDPTCFDFYTLCFSKSLHRRLDMAPVTPQPPSYPSQPRSRVLLQTPKGTRVAGLGPTFLFSQKDQSSIPVLPGGSSSDSCKYLQSIWDFTLVRNKYTAICR